MTFTSAEKTSLPPPIGAFSKKTKVLRRLIETARQTRQVRSDRLFCTGQIVFGSRQQWFARVAQNQFRLSQKRCRFRGWKTTMQSSMKCLVNLRVNRVLRRLPEGPGERWSRHLGDAR